MNWLRKHWWVPGLALALGIALFSPLASPQPDGLERVAKDKGFIDRAQHVPYSIIPDYTIPGIADERLATILAGIVGTLIVFAVSCGLAWALKRKARRTVS